jgi:hypothetical protein
VNRYWLDKPTYSAAHDRVRTQRGPASEQTCVDCEGPASEWSYDHRDPQALKRLVGGRDLTYSADPNHYQPRCHPCHVRFDLPPATVTDGPSNDSRCGTYAGWNAHKRGGTQPCVVCRAAAASYQRDRRRRLRGDSASRHGEPK